MAPASRSSVNPGDYYAVILANGTRGWTFKTNANLL